MSTRAQDNEPITVSGRAADGAPVARTLNIADRTLREALAAGHADRPCLINEDDRWTYAELDERSNRIAHVLTYDFTVEPGDRVLLHASNTPMTVACLLAVIKVGAVAVIAAPLLRARELARIAKVTGAGMCLCDAKLRHTVEEARRRAPQLADIITFNGGFADDDPDPMEARKAGKPPTFDSIATAAEDPCLIAFATGDGGPGKAIWHSHADVAVIVSGTAEHLVDATPNDVVCGTLAVCSTVGLTAQVLAPLARGAACCLTRRGSADALRQMIETNRASICLTTPPIYRHLVGNGRPDAFSSLRKAISTGERLPRATAVSIRSALGIPLIDAVEAAELGGIFLAGNTDELLRPLPGYGISVLAPDGCTDAVDQPGHLRVRGPTGGRVWPEEGEPADTREEWSETGDLAVVDGSGAVRLLGRIEDALTPSGLILPLDALEDTLLSHGRVADSTVFAAPDGAESVTVRAFVAAAGDLPDPLLQDALHAALRAVLDSTAGPKVLLRLWLLDRLPRSEGGKLQREKLPVA